MFTVMLLKALGIDKMMKKINWKYCVLFMLLSFMSLRNVSSETVVYETS